MDQSFETPYGPPVSVPPEATPPLDASQQGSWLDGTHVVVGTEPQAQVRLRVANELERTIYSLVVVFYVENPREVGLFKIAGSAYFGISYPNLPTPAILDAQRPLFPEGTDPYPGYVGYLGIGGLAKHAVRTFEVQWLGTSKMKMHLEVLGRLTPLNDPQALEDPAMIEWVLPEMNSGVTLLLNPSPL